MMKVYHGPQNIGGMAGVLAEAQRKLGVQAYSSCFSTGSFRYKTNHEMSTVSIRYRQWDLLKNLIYSLLNFDVFQFYFGESLTGPKLWDIQLLKKLGKKVFFYFCGCDIRDAKITIEKYKYSACKECWPVSCSKNRRKAIEIVTRLADGIFVSTPDLLEFLPNSIYLPQPIEFEQLSQLSSRWQKQAAIDDKIIVAHAPSDRLKKGTNYIEKAIAELKSEGFNIELLLVEGKSYEEAMRLYITADIAIDQLLIGSYGQYAVEMMGLGKPVICYIREDLRQYYPTDLPIINANPETIASVLKAQIKQRADWPELGQRSIQYVKQFHDSLVAAKKLVDFYQGIKG